MQRGANYACWTFACWTSDQWLSFSTRNDWLFSNNGALGCSFCKSIGNLGVNKEGVGVRSQLSKQWVECSISASGSGIKAQQMSLRKKMFIHKVKESLIAQSAGDIVLTTVVFRTAYYIAKCDRPYTDHPDLLDLQKLNGIKIGRVLQSNVSCAGIIDHIAMEMRHKLTSHIIAQKVLFSILIDESTSLNRTSFCILYIRTTLDVSVGPITFFLDIVQLDRTTSDAITDALCTCLDKHKLCTSILEQFLIGVGVDGAAVMFGSKGGVVAQLKRKFPNIISWHCFNHRLELSVNDAVKCCTEINSFQHVA